MPRRMHILALFNSNKKYQKVKACTWKYIGYSHMNRMHWNAKNAWAKEEENRWWTQMFGFWEIKCDPYSLIVIVQK